MRKDLLSAAVAAFLLLSGDAFARQSAQGQPSQNQAQQSQQAQQAAPSNTQSAAPASSPAATAQAPSSQSTVVSPPRQEDSLAAAARKAREQKKDQAGAKPARGFSSDINEKTDKIEAKKKTIEADQQAIADAEDELHKAGGDPGWAR